MKLVNKRIRRLLGIRKRFVRFAYIGVLLVSVMFPVGLWLAQILATKSDVNQLRAEVDTKLQLLAIGMTRQSTFHLAFSAGRRLYREARNNPTPELTELVDATVKEISLASDTVASHPDVTEERIAAIRDRLAASPLFEARDIGKLLQEPRKGENLQTLLDGLSIGLSERPFARDGAVSAPEPVPVRSNGPLGSNKSTLALPRQDRTGKLQPIARDAAQYADALASTCMDTDVREWERILRSGGRAVLKRVTTKTDATSLCKKEGVAPGLIALLTSTTSPTCQDMSASALVFDRFLSRDMQSTANGTPAARSELALDLCDFFLYKKLDSSAMNLCTLSDIDVPKLVLRRAQGELTPVKFYVVFRERKVN